MPDEAPAPLVGEVLPRSFDSAGAALAACARALGDPRDVATLQAASGLALRISLDRRLTTAGPHEYPWREVLTVAAERLGYRWRLVASESGEPLFAAMQHEVYALAASGAAAGRATLLFGVQCGEFGLVRGVAPGALRVSGMLDGAGAPRELPRERLGEVAGRLFALQLVERVPIDEGAAALATLRAALATLAPPPHVTPTEVPPSTGDAGEDAALQHGVVSSFAPTEHGARAFALWRAALASGDVDPLGLAFAAARYAEARAAVAAWLPEAARLTGLDLSAAQASWRRAAGMLGELARLVPYPPGAGFMFTSTVREEALELVGEAARAESEAVAELGRVLGERARAAAAADLELRPLDGQTVRDLFTCVGEIPLAGLDADAETCRQRLAPTVGGEIDGRLLYHGGAPVGHVLWGPLDAARTPIRADGKRWFLYCPWLESGRRGQGVGARLFAELVAAARAAGVDGIFTLATTLDVFLHHHAFEKHGFVEVDRHGDTRLLELRLTDEPSRARLVPDRPPPPRSGALPVVVSHSYACPLLLRVRRDAARVAASMAPAVSLEESDADVGEPAGVRIAGRALPHAPVAADAIAALLADETRRHG